MSGLVTLPECWAAGGVGISPGFGVPRRFSAPASLYLAGSGFRSHACPLHRSCVSTWDNTLLRFAVCLSHSSPCRCSWSTRLWLSPKSGILAVLPPSPPTFRKPPTSTSPRLSQSRVSYSLLDPKLLILWSMVREKSGLHSID